MHQHEKLYHIGLCKADLEGADYAILPGDPGRVEKIAALMENARQIGSNREYTSWLAETRGVRVLVMSTGMGGPSTAIGVEELHMLGVSHLIRVGTCGGMQLQVQAGDLVVVNGAIRQEGTSKEYLPIEFPAIADIDVTIALRQAAKELGLPSHTGVVQCKDSFYGQHDPARMPVSYELENKWQAWIRGGALGSEMETAALYTVSQVLGVQAGAVMLCVWNQEREKAGLDQKETHDTTGAIRTAIRAVEILAGV
ncbi:uridine phosphorylase [Anaerofilum sp. BX8]|uniref:Uridine phosphorylase n=1 Tax=Anaerofilum hominis TaxID=2763016 RepID=A0A923I9V0_9FIRM|nr:uridine phosphorylase [Anaerofilum hominis]MBC5581486.1 uridine phosphorylase [Anaerofilum hominis]